MPSYVYHVTFARNMPSIKTRGLETGRRRVWKNCFGATLGDVGYVYVFSDWTVAVRWAFHQRWEFKEDVVILCIADPPGILEADPNGIGTYGAGYRVNASIPYERVVKIVPMTDDLARSVVNGREAEAPI